MHDRRVAFRERLQALASAHDIESGSVDDFIDVHHPIDLQDRVVAKGPRERPETTSSTSDTDLRMPATSDSPSAHGPPAWTDGPPRFGTVIVPGLLGDSVQKLVAPLMSADQQLGIAGYDIEVAWVSGRAGCDHNARRLRRAVLEHADRRGDPINLIGYSKGCADALHMLANHADTHEAVRALVSLGGVVYGTPLAAETPALLIRLLQYLPLPGDDVGDRRAVHDLFPAYRRHWLEQHSLPDSLYYASIVAAPEATQVSRILKGSWSRLQRHPGANDSQVIDRDALLPRGDLLAVLRADHWAIALPIAERHPWLSRWWVTRNDFPRAWLLQACIDHLEDAAPRG